MKNDFENTIKPLSSRAKRVLADLSVKDKESLLKIAREDLIKLLGCGKKTIEEIAALQESMEETIETSEVSNALSGCDNLHSDAFDALLGILSKRARNILKILDIKDLKSFMQVKSDQLLNCHQCGQKINNEILSIQTEIKTFILHQINEKGFLQPGELINAPCLAGIQVSDLNGDAGDVSLYTDVNDPALWLNRWVDKLSGSKKQAKAFKLRKGMLGLPPMTLDAIGEQIGVTKERVRQMVIQMEEAAARQQHRRSP